MLRDGLRLGLDVHHAATALELTAGVPGRMERIDAGQPFTVIVDYAHTTDSLRKVLELLRPLTSGRLIAVFGSAGERDPTKRAPMGRAAGEMADHGEGAARGPTLEDPRRDGETLWVIDDRRTAIAHAVGMAQSGDTILLAGKGHEQSIVYGTKKRPWDDRTAALEALAAAEWGVDGRS